MAEADDTEVKGGCMARCKSSLKDDEEDTIDRRGRETWMGKFDFIMTLVGFSVGVGNVWRFPYLCFKNGGGVFFIPYFITLFAAGIPLLFLEISIGQFMQRSDIAAWDIYPALKGIGISTTIIVWYLNLYYIIVITWAIYYFFRSITIYDLPWEKCLDSYDTSASICYDQRWNDTYFSNKIEELSNSVCSAAYLVSRDAYSKAANCPEIVDTAEMFWEKEVLGLSGSFEKLGNVQWHLAIALFVAWILTYVCIIKGIRWTGKVVWFTGLFPYFMLIILFIRGVTLEGAGEGLKFYLQPDFSKLQEGSVWLDAGTQIFWSMSIALGAMPALGSYNKYKTNCMRDTFIYSAVNSGTSIFAGFGIFATLGYMANELGVEVADVAKGGPGLSFIAYPKALSMMPWGKQIFSALFFLMMIFLGLDSEFVAVEGFTAQVMDALPHLFAFKWSREVFITLISIVSYLIGLLMISEGGMYVFQIMDFYSASGIVLLFVAFWESVGIAYFYGGMRYLRDLEAMMGFRVPVIFAGCWYVVTPGICLFIAFFFFQNFEPLSYGGYEYPAWSELIGWCIAGSTCIMIPATALYQLHKHRDNLEMLKTPVIEDHQVHDLTEKPYIIRKYAEDGKTEVRDF